MKENFVEIKILPVPKVIEVKDGVLDWSHGYISVELSNNQWNIFEETKMILEE